MRLLAIGDICSDAGCEYLMRKLPDFKRQQKIDVVIANGENSATNNGITPQSAQHIFACGVDIITGGNHSLRNECINDYIENNQFILRPHNLPEAQFGTGYCLADFGSFTMAVINLSGTIYLERVGASNPFEAVDELLERAKIDSAKVIIVDFHAEATSEKRAMGFYLNGKATAVFGTHTHVQTADEQILSLGTGYITDLGMTGPKDSVLGVKREIIINRLKSNDLSRFVFADGECMLNGCIFDIDLKSGKTIKTERICI
jgi:metallophosphoesterase (TIGR00282 family)